MRRRVVLLFSVMCALLAGLRAAGAAGHSPPFALPATFSGVTICGDCPGIRLTVSLAADGTYSLKREYLERDTSASENGRWTYDAGTSHLRLLPNGKNASSELFAVATKSTLTMLGADGKPIPGPGNVLAQVVTALPLEGTEWSLTAIRTRAYAAQPGERAASLTFEGGHLSGSAGCNRMGGTYQRSGANGLTLSQLVTTRMMCDQHAMEAEGLFTQALASVRSFAVEGRMLVLFDKSGATVAKLLAH
ncbi:MAG TPA: META domain-containing protein [Candidatus Acidoferrales bacterium]|nr:META domain-containing protein [Candidatus Acidoferrales bacterium]